MPATGSLFARLPEAASPPSTGGTGPSGVAHRLPPRPRRDRRARPGRHGDGDHVLPAEMTALRTHEVVAGSSLVLVERDPHAVHVTHPAEVDAALLDLAP